MKLNDRVFHKCGIHLLIGIALCEFIWSCNFHNSNSDQKKTVVTFWYTSGKFALEKLIKDFNSSQDSIYVEGAYQGGYDAILRKLLMGVVTNSTPVIAQIEQSLASQLVEFQTVIALNRFFDDRSLIRDDFIPQILSSSIYGDSIYAIPTNVSIPLMYINRDLLKKAGFPQNYVPKTWTELRNASKAVHKLGNQYYGFDIRIEDWDVETLIWQWGGQIISSDGRDFAFDSPATLSALQFLVDMIKEKSGFITPLPGDVEAFLSGRAAFTNKSSSSYGNFIRHVAFDLDVAPLPEGPMGKVTSSGGANAYFFKNHSEKEYRAAINFIKWILGVQQQIYWSMETGYMVSLWSTVKSDTMQEIFAKDPRRKVPYLAIVNAIPRPRFGPYNQVNRDLIQRFNAALEQQITPEKGIEQAIAFARERLKHSSY